MSTSLSATIMEFLNNIFGDADERAEFLADPEAYFQAHDLDDLSCADFDDALVSFFDNSRGDNNLGGSFENTVPAPGESDHEAIAKHLTEIVHNYGDTYVTNNDNDVVNDNSIGSIIAGDDVTIDNDITSASGDGAVAAGDDINGDVVTGDGNVIGEDNQVGDDSAFGDGANSGSISADDGSSVSLAGDDATSTSTTDNRSDDDVTLTDVGNDKSVNTEIDTDIDTEIDTDIDQSVRNEESFNPSSDDDTENTTTNTNTNDDGLQVVV
ncbi:hypothetical protein [Pseudonocardia sp.]|uniref:hypothetical protein n=1 Tax=Pseudonocardia sp. TaxID=60912 RepID=UPI0026238E21|nr:hypothetical protein [Pseudonocardia sp.]